MEINKENFDIMMVLNDQLSDEMEYTAGICNSIMDGEDPQQFEYTPEEADIRCDAIYKSQQVLAEELKVTIDMLLEMLNSCVVNRWEVYKMLKGVR